jgi:two-component system, NtrC family, response regulator HydG
LQDSASYTGGGKSIARPRNAPPRILVVDDEPDACELLRQILESEGYDAIPETSASSALDRIAKQDFDLVVSDVIMAEMDGLDLCRHIVESRPEVPVILLTGRGNMNTVISALRSGARDFLTKPLDAESVATSVARILQRHALKEPSSIPPEEAPSSGSEPRSTRVLGQSEAIREVYRVIAGLSDSSASVLLQGETGTGKEVIARAIHENSRFKHGPFVALNCAAMPAGLLESELFGHARGAFTDARSATKGLLVQANGGTLLLDEIGELPLAMQPKLLRALQERTVRPVGGSAEVRFDCRLITATNRDLDAEVSAKRFRQDLYYRLDVVRITVPPLRERGDDITLLAEHFLERFSRRSRGGGNGLLTAQVAEKLLAYSWPGNVRELESCMERAVTMARSEQLTVADLPDKIRLFKPSHEVPVAEDPDIDVVTLLEVERRHILRTLKRLGGNKMQAALLLGIDRRTLYRRLQQYKSSDSN